MAKRIAVVGGGGTAVILATDLTLKGHQVTLCDQERHAEKLKGIIANGNRVEMIGKATTGTATLHKITLDITEALADAEVVLPSATTDRHESLTDWMAPHLRDGQIVCFSAGYCASIMLKRKVGSKNILVADMQGNIYPARLVGETTVCSAFPYKEKGVAAFPAKDTSAFIDAFKEIYPCRPVKNVFEAALNSPNVSIHLAGSLLATTKMETMDDFRLYRDGMCPSMLRLIEAVEVEKAQVMEKMGYFMGSALQEMKNVYDYKNHPELETFRLQTGPSGVNHRYVTEDAGAGNSLLLSLAKALGVKAAVVDALITIASALNKTDFYAKGLTLENLGLTGLSPEAINAYLETGVKS